MSLRNEIAHHIIDAKRYNSFIDSAGKETSAEYRQADLIIAAVRERLTSTQTLEAATGEYKYHTERGRDPVAHVIATVIDTALGEEHTR